MAALLKIGRLDLLEGQKEKALLSYFDKVVVFTYTHEKEKYAHIVKQCRKRYGNRLKVIDLNVENDKLNARIKRLVDSSKANPRRALLMELLVIMARIHNYKLIRQVKQYQFKFIHSSFSDWDCSDFLTILLSPCIKGELVRIYKESRPGFNWCEKRCFEMADRILLSDNINQTFYEQKYGKDFFKNMKLELGYDENILSRDIIDRIVHKPKLSEKDNKKHFVILAGRVLCDPLDARSGARLYYIPIIQELINNGFVVHLHTLNILTNSRGENVYELLRQKYPALFFIENPLDMVKTPVESIQILSRYDFGILHNFMRGATVSKFDQTNIPHRFYEYEAAHVVPVVLNKTASLMEKIFREYSCGVVADNYSECQNFDVSQIKWFIPDYESYIERIYHRK